MPVIEELPVEKIVRDYRARDGTWCKHPYPGHPNGCPNFVKGCTMKRPLIALLAIEEGYRYILVYSSFDLKAHAAKMKEKHPDWSDRHCRSPLYWQGTVRSRLRNSCKLVMKAHEGKATLLDIPEACGINMFETMRNMGVELERTNPDRVYKAMIIRIQK